MACLPKRSSCDADSGQVISRVLTLALVASCNQVYDIRETHLPPADAAPFCPESGPPPISRRLVQVAAGACLDYSFSEVTRRALALCRIDAPPYVGVHEGQLDSQLAEAAFLLGGPTCGSPPTVAKPGHSTCCPGSSWSTTASGTKSGASIAWSMVSTRGRKPVSSRW